jgi:collagen beta-1,O-galactosyltransferase
LGWGGRYLGRKRSVGAKEPWVKDSRYIVEVDYTYWTLGYGLTSRGARKLIQAKPFEQLLPLDEFLPIMFNRHIK